MKLTRRTAQEGTVTLGTTGEELAVRRVDRYTRPGQWFWQAPEEVEIWALADGRQVRVTRRGNREWQSTWRVGR